MRNWMLVVVMMALVGCGEDAEEQYCAILLPLAAVSTQQGEDTFADYCLECSIDGETYLVVNSFFEGIEVYPVDSGLGDGCGSLTFHPQPTFTPGTYEIELGTYRVGDYDVPDYDAPTAGARGGETATITLTVTGEDCTNGTDDDDDGAVDCDDLDNCAPTPACQVSGG